MNAYADTGLIVKSYVDEENSAKADAILAEAGTPLAFSHFHAVEIPNAIHLKRFRREITPDQEAAAIRAFQGDIDAGRLQRTTISEWFSAAQRRFRPGTPAALEREAWTSCTLRRPWKPDALSLSLSMSVTVRRTRQWTVEPRIARMNTDDGGQGNPTSSAEGKSGTAGVRRLAQDRYSFPVQAPVVIKNYRSDQSRAPQPLRLTEFGETTDNQITNLPDHLQFLAERHRIELLMLMPPTTRPRRRAPVNFRCAFRDHNSKACRAKDSTHQYRPDQCPVQPHASFRAEFATGRFGR
jgi:hypothetical protein